MNRKVIICLVLSIFALFCGCTKEPAELPDCYVFYYSITILVNNVVISDNDYEEKKCEITYAQSLKIAEETNKTIILTKVNGDVEITVIRHKKTIKLS